jgi:3-methyladenine DNA glycosylase/8-oxoguanine DNA glycosylase
VPRDQALSATFDLTRPINLDTTLRSLQVAGGDPTLVASHGSALRACWTQNGPATVALTLDVEAGRLHAKGWGPGAGDALSHVPDLVGLTDSDAGLSALLREPGRPGRALLRDLQFRLQGLRLPRTSAIFNTLVPAILGQRVRIIDAADAYRRLVRAFGERAPGPAHLADQVRLPPAPETLAEVPYWRVHEMGIERKRWQTIRYVAQHASSIERLLDLPSDQLASRLGALPGVGPWTVGHVQLLACGDADAVIHGDLHLPHGVCWALGRKPRGDDAAMLEFLEHYRGERGRVTRLIVAGGISAPRFAPRLLTPEIRYL